MDFFKTVVPFGIRIRLAFATLSVIYLSVFLFYFVTGVFCPRFAIHGIRTALQDMRDIYDDFNL